MSSDPNKHPNPRNEKPISLHPLTADQALAAALNVKKADVAKLEEAEGQAKAKARKSKK